MLAIDRKNFGENHPDTAICYNNLGSAYKALGEYGKAIEYYEKAIKMDQEGSVGENARKMLKKIRDK